MHQLGLTRYDMELGFSEQFASQERELEIHDHQYLHAPTRLS